MLLTILGALIGGFLSMAIGKCVGMDFDKRFALGTGDMFTLFGTVLGAGIGLGYGSTLLASGSHPYNALVRFVGRITYV